MASKIKIRIVDKESNFKLWLPAIPFWLITSLSSLALRFGPFILKDDEGTNNDVKLLLQQIDKKMIKDFIKEFRKHGKFDLVDISTGDGTIVKISIL